MEPKRCSVCDKIRELLPLRRTLEVCGLPGEKGRTGVPSGGTLHGLCEECYLTLRHHHLLEVKCPKCGEQVKDGRGILWSLKVTEIHVCPKGLWDLPLFQSQVDE